MERLKEGATFFSKLGGESAADSDSVRSLGQGRDSASSVKDRWMTAIRYGGKGASPSAQWNDGQNAKAMVTAAFAAKGIPALKRAGRIPSKTGGDYSAIVKRRQRLAESIAYIKQNIQQYKYNIKGK
jgi:hypothetical protein